MFANDEELQLASIQLITTRHPPRCFRLICSSIFVLRTSASTAALSTSVRQEAIDGVASLGLHEGPKVNVTPIRAADASQPLTYPVHRIPPSFPGQIVSIFLPFYFLPM